ncbi:MAG: oxidoreductase [Candidatus Njordarchaeota archaeon]
MPKLRVAILQGAACDGCGMSLVDLHEKLGELLENVEIVFWLLATDFKYEDLEKIDSIDALIYYGAIRTEEHKHIVEEFAKKAKIVIAYGACACYGGIPLLSNLYEGKEVLKEAYTNTVTTDNPDGKIPGDKFAPYGVDISIPKYLEWGLKLDDVVDVHIYVPGCPPGEEVMEEFMETIKKAAMGEKIEKGVVLAKIKTVCDFCEREKPEKIIIDRFRRVHEVKIDPNKCFLAQGIICLGPITRAGCGARCINANMPCRGCFGPAPNVYDPGAKLISALAALIELENEPKISDEELMRRVQESVMDPVGLFYRFTLGKGFFNKVQADKVRGQ